MAVTRHLWAVSALVVFLAVLAAVVARPLLLVGAALIGAWLLATQYCFVTELERTARSLSLTQEPSRSDSRTNESVSVRLTATLEEPSSLSLIGRAGLPTAAVTTDRPSLTVSLDPGSRSAERAVDVSWPVAGRHLFDPMVLTATDGLFVATHAVADRPTVTVDSRGPRAVHVGESGDPIATAYGDHESDRRGSGIEPAEIREYAPGDATKRIDWKVTARLATPHVRDYEADTDRETLLVVDQRSSLSTGPPAETKLDYLRAVALVIASKARELGDPTGYLAVGDEGLTTHLEPAGTPAVHATIRRELLEVEPTEPRRPASESTEAPADGPSRPAADGPTLRAVRRSVVDLESDDDRFAETLRPFYADQQRYRRRLQSKPLFRSVRTVLTANPDSTWTVLFTDDTAPAELRATVSLARQSGAAVTVFLAPTVLYEAEGLVDLETAYDRYEEFEELRRDLARMQGVDAFEVAPGDRLAAVLEMDQSRARGGSRDRSRGGGRERGERS